MCGVNNSGNKNKNIEGEINHGAKKPWINGAREKSNKKIPGRVLYMSMTARERGASVREKEREREIKRMIKPTPGRRKAAGTVNSGEIGAINTQRPNFALPARRRPSITRVEEGGSRTI